MGIFGLKKYHLATLFQSSLARRKGETFIGIFFLLRIDFFGYKSIGFVLLLSAKTAYKASR
jgi:hypothetical protein